MSIEAIERALIYLDAEDETANLRAAKGILREALSAPVASDARELAESLWDLVHMAGGPMTEESAMSESAAEIERFVAERGGEMREALERIIDHAEDWHAHYCEMWGERRKEQQDAILGDIMNARALLARESAERTIKDSLTVAEPAEERGPEVGDIVAWMRDEYDEGVPTVEIVESADRARLLCKATSGRFRILMRRAEVEARIGGKTPEEEA